MLKETCDECGNNLATFIYKGENPIPSYNKLSNIAGNLGFCLCDPCKNIDVSKWQNIEIARIYHDKIRNIIKESLNGF